MTGALYQSYQTLILSNNLYISFYFKPWVLPILLLFFNCTLQVMFFRTSVIHTKLIQLLNNQRNERILKSFYSKFFIRSETQYISISWLHITLELKDVQFVRIQFFILNKEELHCCDVSIETNYFWCHVSECLYTSRYLRSFLCSEGRLSLFIYIWQSIKSFSFQIKRQFYGKIQFYLYFICCELH